MAQVKQLVGSRAGIWCLVSKPMAKDYTAQPHGDVTKMLLCVRHFVTLSAEFHITLPATPSSHDDLYLTNEETEVEGN